MRRLDERTVLLSWTYFGPVQWYQKLVRHAHCVMDGGEYFVKQTYRNRCLIATTAGVQALTVPTEAPTDARQRAHTPMHALQVSPHGQWQHLHWQALCSAYGESPFFEYYADDLQPFFTQTPSSLLSLNRAITYKMCELLHIEPQWEERQDYVDADVLDASTSCIDFRTSIRPKNPLPDPDFTPRPYWQVFQQKHGFLPNLSILDLLFCQGPEAPLYLI